MKYDEEVYEHLAMMELAKDVMNKPVADIYEAAQQYAVEEQHEAREWVMQMDVEDLREELLDAIGRVAYYTKIEAALSAKPRLHYDAMREAYIQLGAENLLAQAEHAIDQGVEISGTVTVKSKPLINLLNRVRSILG